MDFSPRIDRTSTPKGIRPSPYEKTKSSTTKFRQTFTIRRSFLKEITPSRRSLRSYEGKRNNKRISSKENTPVKEAKSPAAFLTIRNYGGAKRRVENSFTNSPHYENNVDDDDDVQLSDRYDSSVLKENKLPQLENVTPRKITDFYQSKPNIIKPPSSTSKIVRLYNDEDTQCDSVDECLQNDENQEPHVSSLTDNIPETHYMMGFPNYGNTCYLNAVLQTLSGLETFIGDLGCLNKNDGIVPSSLTLSIWSVILAKYKRNVSLIQKSLRDLKQSIEKVDDSFAGFKMQDATEFLTQVLDTMKEEVNEFIHQKSSCTQLAIDDVSTVCVSELSTGTNVEPIESIIPREPSVFDTPSSSESISQRLGLGGQGDPSDSEENIIVNEFLPERDQEMSPLKPPVSNPVLKNFQFELLESYECLGCKEVLLKKEKNFALYVNLPQGGFDNLQSAIDSYMSSDQRELTCNKCGHKTALVYPSFQQLPRILIVQLKRYEYDPLQQECIKVSSQVRADKWLRLKPHSASNVNKPPHYVPVPISLSQSKENKTTLKDLDSEFNKGTFSFANELGDDISLFSPVKFVIGDNEGKVESKEASPIKSKVVEVESVEDDEFQQAIKLSLQESNLCFETYASNPAQDLPSSSTTSVDITSTEPEENSYKLISIVSHFGQTTSTGHYVSDVFNIEENQWLHYDDESVSKVSEEAVFSEGRQKNGYIFFYVHRDIYYELVKK